MTTNDVITMSLPKTMEKQWGNADLRETKQIIYQSKGINESYPKIYFLLNLSHYVKSCGHFCQILAFFTMPAHQIWSYHITQISKNFYFVLILHLVLGKVTKFPMEKLSTSEVISQNTLRGEGVENIPPPVPLGLKAVPHSHILAETFATF